MALDKERLYIQLGQRIRERRVALGLKQADVMRSTGLLRTSITNIEAGRQRPPLHVLYEICAALDVEVADVLPRRSELVEVSEHTLAIEGLERYVPPELVAHLKELDQELVKVACGEKEDVKEMDNDAKSS